LGIPIFHGAWYVHPAISIYAKYIAFWCFLYVGLRNLLPSNPHSFHSFVHVLHRLLIPIHRQVIMWISFLLGLDFDALIVSTFCLLVICFFFFPIEINVNLSELSCLWIQALEYLGKSRGIQRTRELAAKHANLAAAAIDSLPETDDEEVRKSRRALVDLTQRVITRNKWQNMNSSNINRNHKK